MSVLNAIANPMNDWRTGSIKKNRFDSWSLAVVISCLWALGPSGAECAPASPLTASSRLIHPSVPGTHMHTRRRGGSVTRNTEGGEFDQRELSALNQLGIRYAKGHGVKQNPALARRFFRRAALQGYTPAMANLGTLYEIGARKHYDFQHAYAWVRAALCFGVSEEDHDETVAKLWMIAARLGPDRIESAERLADVIATRVVETCKCSPGPEAELVSIDFL